jgi:hypothetical protein
MLWRKLIEKKICDIFLSRKTSKQEKQFNWGIPTEIIKDNDRDTRTNDAEQKYEKKISNMTQFFVIEKKKKRNIKVTPPNKK